MRKNAQFLVVLWIFVICDFVLFQNFTQNVSPLVMHNDECKQSFALNESRILHVNGLQADVVAIWPKSATSDPVETLKSMTSILLDSNRQIYDSCVADNAVKESHVYALSELKKLADPDTDGAWKKHVAVLDSALKALKGLQ